MHHVKLILIILVVSLVAIWLSGGKPLAKFTGK
jgi:hypothetical protein